MKVYFDCKGLQNEEVEAIIRKNFENCGGIFTNQEVQLSDLCPIYTISETNQIYQHKKVVGKRVIIDSPRILEKLLNSDIQGEFLLLIETKDWKIIPLENLIAKFRNTGVSILVYVSSLVEIKLVQEILEFGVTGIIITYDFFIENREYFDGVHLVHKIELVELEVSSIEMKGSGERVCVDTVSLLNTNEGMLIGAVSSVFALIEPEVKRTEYLEPRPFRINAGPVSSYALGMEKTNYLSELCSGSTVMIVSNDGRIREEIVARVKIERRPLFLLQLKYKGAIYPLFLQNAETVRLLAKGGSISVTKIKVGDKILGTVSEKGRHLGMQIDEYIEER